MIETMIQDKRNGLKWSEANIKQIVDDYTNNLITDEAMTKWLKCIFEYGLDDEETLFLTTAQLQTGEVLDLTKIKGIKVDKHSTGGVGDKTTLIILPIVASLGIPVAKLSGRALGHTGGTIDKLESIPGFNVSLYQTSFINQVNNIKVAITGQTGNLAPADKKIYALRDITNTVKSIPLITASIMSKKLASGSDKIVLDVKYGNGAFCDTMEMADALANKMVKIGNMFGKETIAIITDMNQPLGYAIGNSVEVAEAIATLQGRGPVDLTELSIHLSSQMVKLAKDISSDDARLLVESALISGRAYQKFLELVETQGGQLDHLIEAMEVIDVVASVAGYIESIATKPMGELVMSLGAGRHHLNDPIDYQVGIILSKKIGDYVNVGESLMKIRTRKPVVIKADDYFKIVAEQVTRLPLIYKTVTGETHE